MIADAIYKYFSCNNKHKMKVNWNEFAKQGIDYERNWNGTAGRGEEGRAGGNEREKITFAWVGSKLYLAYGREEEEVEKQQGEEVGEVEVSLPHADMTVMKRRLRTHTSVQTQSHTHTHTFPHFLHTHIHI